MTRVYFSTETGGSQAGIAGELSKLYKRTSGLCALTSAILCLFSGHLRAQSEQKIPPPKEPLVASVPDMMKVTLVFKEEENAPQAGVADPISAATASSKWKSIEITKTGEVRLLKATMMDGKSYDTWIFCDRLFDKTFDGKQVSCVSYNSTLPSFFQPTNTVFFGTEWIRLEDFKGVVSLNGKHCYYFEKEGEPFVSGFNPAVVPRGSDTPPMEHGKAGGGSGNLLKAWIDVTTKLPVAVTLPEGLVRYRFAAPPQLPLSPPTEYVEYFLRMKREAERRQREAAIR